MNRMTNGNELILCPFSEASLLWTPLKEAASTVLICPGGGYGHLSQRESEPVANAFRKYGFSTAILRYTVRGTPAQAPLKTLPLKELAWAARRIRSGKRRDTDAPLFVCGFSAGAHLAASLGVHWRDAALFSLDGECQAQRPDGLILCYPVITAGTHAHRASIENLTGGDEALNEYFNLEKHVDPLTPRTFLWHTMSDEAVPVQNSILFYQALVNAGVYSELHIFPRGAHGLSLATPETQQIDKGRFANAHIASWVKLCVEWMQQP